LSSIDAYPLPGALATIIIVAFSLAWGVSSAYAVLAEKPQDIVYVAEPWPANATLLGGGCMNGSPVLIASQGSLFTFKTLVYTPNWSVELEDFNPQAFCVGANFIAVAGSYNETPALAIMRGPGYALLITLPSSGPASFNTVGCWGSSVMAAGPSIEGIVLLKVDSSGGRTAAWLIRYSAPVLSILERGKSLYLLTASGVVVFNPNSTAILYDTGAMNSTWERLTEGPGGVWLIGSLELGNTSWAAIAPLEGGRAILLKARGYDGLVIDAAARGLDWLVYYRPGSYWDCLAHIRGSAVDGVKLLWSGPHEVVSVYMDRMGHAVTATLVTGAREYAVLACIGSVREAHYWLGNESILHASLIPVTEKLVVRSAYTPRPLTSNLTAKGVKVKEAAITLNSVGHPPHFERASLRWEGPLEALTYIALSIVLAVTLRRSFVGGELGG